MKKFYLMSIIMLIIFLAGCGSNNFSVNPVNINRGIQFDVEWPQKTIGINGAPPAEFNITTVEVVLIEKSKYLSFDEILQDTCEIGYFSEMSSDTTETYNIEFHSFNVEPDSEYYNGATIEDVKTGDYYFMFIAYSSGYNVEFSYADYISVKEGSVTYVKIESEYWNISVPVTGNYSPQLDTKDFDSIDVVFDKNPDVDTYEIYIDGNLEYSFGNESNVLTYTYTFSGLSNGTTYDLRLKGLSGEDTILDEVLTVRTDFFADSTLRAYVIEQINLLKDMSITGEDDLTLELLSDPLLTSLNINPNTSNTGPEKAPGTPVSTLKGIEFLVNLTVLDISGNNITDISDLGTLTDLVSLNMANNTIADISVLVSLTSITALDLSGNGISNISPLENLTVLENLNISNNTISDIKSLATLIGIKNLNMSDNGIADLTPLSNLTGILSLSLGNNNIGDISALSGLTSLTDLNMDNNNITDISAISTLVNLINLSLSNTQVTDISVLGDLPALSNLSIANNPNISDYSVLVSLGVTVTGIELVPVLSNVDVAVEYRTGTISVNLSVLGADLSIQYLDGSTWKDITTEYTLTGLSTGTYEIIWDTYSDIPATLTTKIRVGIAGDENSYIETENINIDNVEPKTLISGVLASADYRIGAVTFEISILSNDISVQYSNDGSWFDISTNDNLTGLNIGIHGITWNTYPDIPETLSTQVRVGVKGDETSYVESLPFDIDNREPTPEVSSVSLNTEYRTATISFDISVVPGDVSIQFNVDGSWVDITTADTLTALAVGSHSITWDSYTDIRDMSTTRLRVGITGDANSYIETEDITIDNRDTNPVVTISDVSTSADGRFIDFTYNITVNNPEKEYFVYGEYYTEEYGMGTMSDVNIPVDTVIGNSSGNISWPVYYDLKAFNGTAEIFISAMDPGEQYTEQDIYAITVNNMTLNPSPVAFGQLPSKTITKYDSVGQLHTGTSNTDMSLVYISPAGLVTYSSGLDLYQFLGFVIDENNIPLFFYLDSLNQLMAVDVNGGVFGTPVIIETSIETFPVFGATLGKDGIVYFAVQGTFASSAIPGGALPAPKRPPVQGNPEACTIFARTGTYPDYTYQSILVAYSEGDSAGLPVSFQWGILNGEIPIEADSSGNVVVYGSSNDELVMAVINPNDAIPAFFINSVEFIGAADVLTIDTFMTSENDVYIAYSTWNEIRILSGMNGYINSVYTENMVQALNIGVDYDGRPYILYSENTGMYFPISIATSDDSGNFNESLIGKDTYTDFFHTDCFDGTIGGYFNLFVDAEQMDSFIVNIK